MIMRERDISVRYVLPILSCLVEVDLGSEFFFWFGTQIRRDRLDFMSISVFSMCGKIPLVQSP